MLSSGVCDGATWCQMQSERIQRDGMDGQMLRLRVHRGATWCRMFHLWSPSSPLFQQL